MKQIVPLLLSQQFWLSDDAYPLSWVRQNCSRTAMRMTVAWALL